MATTQTATIQAMFKVLSAKTLALSQSAQIQAPSKTITTEFASGTSKTAAQAILTKAWSGTITGGGAAVDLDMDGSNLDIWGDAVALDAVKAILFRNASTFASPATAGNMTLSGDFMNVLTGGTASVTLAPGAYILYCRPYDGWEVTATSGDVVSVANASGSLAMDYEVIVMGV